MLTDFLFLAAGIFTIYLGITVWIRGKNEAMYQVFTFFSTMLGLWAISLILLNQTHDILFGTIAMFFSLVGIAALPLFTYTFPHNPYPRKLFWLLYIPLVGTLIALAVIGNQPPLVFSDGVIQPIPGLGFTIFSLTLAFYLVVALVIYLYRFSTTSGNDRLRVQYIGLGLITFVAMGLFGTVVLPYFDDYSFLFTAPMSAFLALLTLTSLAVLREELVDIRIVVIEIVVFLAAGIVLINNLLRAGGYIEFLTTGFLLAIFLFTAGRLVALLIKTMKQRQNLKEANVRLKELMSMKSEFLQIASHQLRAPLTSLYGLIQMEAAGEFNDLPEDKRKELHGHMLTSAEQLRNLVNDLLRALKLEGEKLPLHFESIDVIDIIQEAIASLKVNYEQRKLSLTFNEPRRRPKKISADPDYLRQVFINLIDNAEKYTKEGGTTITIDSDWNNVTITVHDTGIGIENSEKQLLCQKFVRGERAQEVCKEGTGLGLFITKKIVESHGGTFALESEGIGKGTRAVVTLPFKQKKAPTANHPHNQEEKKS